MDTQRYMIPISMVGGLVANVLGGFDSLLKALLFMMLMDIIAGICSAAFFNTSKYSRNGITSDALIKGIIRKVMMLVIISIATVLDGVLDLDYIRNCACIYLIGTEGVSLIEHMMHMNVPFPKFIKDIMETLLEKGDNGNEFKD